MDVSGTGHPAAEWAGQLARAGVLVTTVAGRVRMLTHVNIAPADIGAALDAWRNVVRSGWM
jgi:hypothetical protein